MFHNIKRLLLTLLVATTAFADNQPIRNEGLSALRDLGSELTVGSNYATDRFGQLMPQYRGPFVNHLGNDTAETGSTTTNIVATAHAVKVGDVVEFTTAARSGMGYVTSIATNSFTISPPLRAAPNNGDFFYVNAFMPAVVNSSGQLITTIQDASGTAVNKAEDTVMNSADMGFDVFQKLQSALTVDAASGDRGTFKGDLDGRTITSLAPAGEMWQSCGTATATTSDVAIKAAVASNRIYVTSITCKNTSATVATSLDFKDGTTVIAVGGISQMATTAAGSFDAAFPVPLRGTSNTALNFATNVSVSSVTCCAAGYIGVN